MAGFASDTMHWAGALSRRPTVAEALTEATRAIRSQMAGRRVDLLFVFASPDFAQGAGQWLGGLQRELACRVQIGCSGGGIIGAGSEVEGPSALSLLAAHLPGVELRPFWLKAEELPDLDSSPKTWENLMEISAGAAPHFVLMVDGSSFPVDVLIGGLDFAFPKAIKVGGLASGGNRPGQNRLFFGDQAVGSGAVGVVLAGDIAVEAAVAQGCRPVGETFQITRAEGNLLWELDGQPALQVLQTVLQQLDENDQRLARNALFVGVRMSEFHSGSEQGDFLVRNLMGVDSRTGGLAVGEWLRTGQTVRFHLRDAATSRDDLQLVLQRHRLEHSGAPPAGALLFSCLGRGESLYGEPDVDSTLFAQVLGEGVPLAGFFCNGEIGPVGSTTFLHGYTSSFGLFRPRTSGRL
ncbi:FIST signal transduction protein [Gloeobacter violaceus]|uniref:Gll0826 protein n=1 Tax=Gloeobacter violaceus (strain ATCC 29082 / PCC 7421) TaxID=251221 RepID=Q7NME0_GLOVI|nr:FIST N-terminal domain-containing protein [Gloeobacter violaceus]BAC88767.1 gll0826 [Gloeobacter violaceus PCC 7421]